MKKNVLIVAYDGMNKSGVPGVIMEILCGLHNEFNFTLAVFEDVRSHFYYEKLKELNIDIINVIYNKNNNKIKKAYDEYIGFHSFTFSFFNSLFQKKHFDVVHSFKEGDSSGLFKAAKRNGIQLRIWHTTVLHEYQKTFLGLLSKHKLRLSLKYASCFVGGSLLSCKLAFGRRDFKVIPNCYKSDVYSFIGSGPFNNLEMIQIGYYSENKNQMFTIDACKLIAKEFPTFKMHFVGYANSENYFENLKEKIKKENLEKNVVFHDSGTNQIDIIKNCSYLLLPSIREGFSLTLIEAQACGLKCIASASVPPDANAGGIKYLNLSAELWSNYIINDFKKTHGKHTFFVMEKYSRKTFLDNIRKLYSF